MLPEAALSVDDTTPPVVEAAFAQVARERATAVVVGVARASGGRKYANAVIVDRTGAVAPRYPKHHDRVSPLGRDLSFVPGTPTPTGS